MSAAVYKVLTEPQWNQFKQEGSYAGTPVDKQDGFIHLSAQAQVAGVIDRYYAGQRPLYVVEFSAAACGESLRWEPASNGEKFPHLYGRALVFKEVVSFRVI